DGPRNETMSRTVPERSRALPGPAPVRAATVRVAPTRTGSECPMSPDADRMPSDAALGDRLLTLTVGPPAAGGTFVARHEGRVVFVRGAAPGETVTARLLDDPTEKREARFWRAEALDVLEAGVDRVPRVWEAAGVDGVGGADRAHRAPTTPTASPAARASAPPWTPPAASGCAAGAGMRGTRWARPRSPTRRSATCARGSGPPPRARRRSTTWPPRRGPPRWC